MTDLLGLVLLSFAVTSFFMVPFIDILFYLKRRFERFKEDKSIKKDIPITDKLLGGQKANTPHGGGILLILVVIVLSTIYSFYVSKEDLAALKILLFSLLSFGALGFLDDVKWLLVKREGKFIGVSRRAMLVVQLVLATTIAWMLYSIIGLNNIYITGLGNFIIGAWYIPFAAFVIIAFSNAYNISDGLDGLSTGLLLICLFAFLALASANLDLNLAAFIGIWVGTLFAFLYFNVYPARIFLGDAGALAFGATLAIVGLLSGKVLALPIIGGMYVVIIASSLLQILSKKFLKRKLFAVAPIHMYLKYIGWEEPKIVTRLWLAGAIFAIFGLWLALLIK